MRIAAKFARASAVALFAGSMMLLAPGCLTGGDLAHAEPDAEPAAQAREKLDAAARTAFSQIDNTVTGSLPRDAAAAEAANPMTARFLGIETNTGFPAIAVEKAADPVETVGAIPPRDVKPEAAGDVTASVGTSPAVMPAPKRAQGAEVAQPAPAKQARRSRPNHRPQADTAPRFQDRGPVAKVFRVFVMGVGFLPSQF